MPTIRTLDALEILDSRGRPTLQATCVLADGVSATAQVPSGASTGRAEAHELRDGDVNRHGGWGCRKAVASVRGPIRAALAGTAVAHQRQLDEALIQLDGTPNKARLGANAILAVSLAFARAVADSAGTPLYQHFAQMAGFTREQLPRPTINLFSGGKHAGGQVAIQDVLIVPIAARRIDEVMAHACAVFQSAAQLCHRKYHARTLVADEGGLAPPFTDTTAMLDNAVEAIRDAGFKPGRDVALAVDVAASHFYEAGRYRIDQEELSSPAMIGKIASWLDRYPIISVEDGLAEEDVEFWPSLRERIQDRALVLGDDLLCTNPDRIRRAVDLGWSNALLLKVNQIGTLSEALDSLHLARAAQWHVTISARSGETEDHWLADLAVGWGGDHLKVGSVTRSERLAKYNRLLQIENALGWRVC